jgi:hypothetical protein
MVGPFVDIEFKKVVVGYRTLAKEGSGEARERDEFWI